MNVPEHYAKVSRGFWNIFRAQLPADVQSTLPGTSDRYYESVHFAELALTIPPAEDQARYVNWYFSAHSAAYIGIFDAAKQDIERAHSHVKFSDTPLHKELRANSHANEFLYKDPVNASQLYRALRNLRIHFARDMAVLEVRPISSNQPHWYVQMLDPAAYRLLRNHPLTDQQLNQYNGYLHNETIMDVFGRMLGIIRENIVETSSLIVGKRP